MNGPVPEPPPPVPAVARHSLPRAFRLAPAGYRSTFDNGESVASRFFVMWVHRVQDGAEGQVGTVASKKTFHDAVQRNRAKRLLREAYRRNRPGLVAGVRIILLGRRRILEATSREVSEDFRRTCRKAGIWEEGK